MMLPWPAARGNGATVLLFQIRVVRRAMAESKRWVVAYGHVSSTKTPIAVQYGVHAIPCAVLVDGDTGLIIATDLGAIGHKLTKAVESALATKAKK